MPIKILWFATLLGLACGASSAVSAQTAGAEKPRFLMFDGLLYKGKPDLAPLGFMPIRGVNPPVANGVADAEVDQARTRATFRDLADYRGLVYLDYEQWEILRRPRAEGEASIGKFIHVLQIARSGMPRATIGYYGAVPCGDYWGLMLHDAARIAQLEDCDSRGAAIAAHADVTFPSLYTFYNDQNGWDVYGARQIKAARQYHKPVYAFLWPEFHVSNAKLHDTNVPAGFWRHELEFCRARADGIVIWGGWQKPWNEQAPWWLETKAFLVSLGSR